MRLRYAIAGYCATPFVHPWIETEPNTIQTLLRLHRILSDQIKKGPIEYVTCLNPGFDIAAARYILTQMKAGKAVELFCILPSEEQANDWPEEWREEYFFILEHCTASRYISLHQQSDSLRRAYEQLLVGTGLLLTNYDGAISELTPLISRAEQKRIPIEIVRNDNIISAASSDYTK